MVTKQDYNKVLQCCRDTVAYRSCFPDKRQKKFSNDPNKCQIIILLNAKKSMSQQNCDAEIPLIMTHNAVAIICDFYCHIEQYWAISVLNIKSINTKNTSVRKTITK